MTGPLHQAQMRASYFVIVNSDAAAAMTRLKTAANHRRARATLSSPGEKPLKTHKSCG